jgi:hypothetical protein
MASEERPDVPIIHVNDLTVDPEFEKLVPPMMEEEREMLKKNIQRDVVSIPSRSGPTKANTSCWMATTGVISVKSSV